MSPNTGVQTSLKFTQWSLLITFGESSADAMYTVIDLLQDKTNWTLSSLVSWEILVLFVHEDSAELTKFLFKV